MNNFEKIKQMTVDEMAEMLREFQDNPVYLCTFVSPCDKCSYADCLTNTKQWLLQEVEE